MKKNNRTNNPNSGPQDDAQRAGANWDITNAPKNYISLVFTQIIGMLFAFSSVFLISRELGAIGYGRIVAIIAASQIAQILVHWTSITLIKFGTEEFIDTERISRIFWVRILILIPNALLLLLLSYFWYPLLSGLLKLTTDQYWLVVLHFVGTSLWVHMQFSLQGIKKQTLQGGLLAIERVLVFLALAGLFVSNLLSPVTAMLCYAIMPFAMAFVGFGFLRNYVFTRFDLDWIFLKEIFTYSIPLLPFSLVGYLSTGYIDAVFLASLLSVKDLGIYTIATQINGMALQVLTLANSLLIPLFVTLGREAKSSYTAKYFKHMIPSFVLIWGFLCMIASIVTYFLVPLLFGEAFADARNPLWILLTSTAIALPAAVGYIAFAYAISETSVSMFAAVFSAVANIAANFILIPKFGLLGCAWATSIALLASVATFSFLLRKKVKLPISWTFLAMIPNVGGAVCFSLTENPFYSVFVCVVLTAVVLFQHAKSFKTTIELVRSIYESRAVKPLNI